jgi:hypothetical protein
MLTVCLKKPYGMHNVTDHTQSPLQKFCTTVDNHGTQQIWSTTHIVQDSFSSNQNAETWHSPTCQYHMFFIVIPNLLNCTTYCKHHLSMLLISWIFGYTQSMTWLIMNAQHICHRHIWPSGISLISDSHLQSP